MRRGGANKVGRQRAARPPSVLVDAVTLLAQLLMLGAASIGTYGLWRWLAALHPPLLLDRVVLVVGSALVLRLAVRLRWAPFGPVTVLTASIIGGMAGPSLADAHPRTVAGHIVRWVIASILAMVVKLVQLGEAQGIQDQSDRDAATIFAAPRAGGYWLYLRPFSTDGRIPVQLPSDSSMMTMPGSGNASYIDLQTVLRDAAPSGVKFVAIGRPGDVMSGGSWNLSVDAVSLELSSSAALGAGKATVTSEEWRSKVREAAEGADKIFVVPFGHHAGTMWEVGMIRERGYLPKTVFIMPETLGYARFEDSWSKARAACATTSLQLPAYVKAGMLFTMSGDGTMAAGYKLRANLGRAVRVRRLLQRLESESPVLTGAGPGPRL